MLNSKLEQKYSEILNLFDKELGENVVNTKSSLGILFRKTMDFLLNYCNYIYVLHLYQFVHLKCLTEINQINNLDIHTLLKCDRELIKLIYYEYKLLKYELEEFSMDINLFDNYWDAIINLKNYKLNYIKTDNINYHKLLINLSVYWTKIKTLDTEDYTNLRLLADLTRFFLYNLYQFNIYFNHKYPEHINLVKNIRKYFEKNDNLFEKSYFIYQELTIKYMILLLENDETIENIPNHHDIDKPNNIIVELNEFIEITNQIIDSNECKYKIFKYFYKQFYNYQKLKTIITTLDNIVDKLYSSLVLKKIK